VLGAAPDCSIRLDDKSERVSRRHARLDHDAGTWVISDLGSTNGIRLDGEERKSFPVAPGVEIELGGVKLIAESQRSIELRELLSVFLGWSPSRLEDGDRALRAVRQMASLRTSLVLRGDGSLLGVVRRIHELILGDRCPLVVLEPGELGVPALARATGGLLYVDARSLPADIRLVVVSLRLSATRVRLILGANSIEAAAEVATLIPSVTTIWIPPLAERQDEIERILHSYGRDAVAKLRAPGTGLRPHDMKWIRESAIKTLEEAEEVMLRVVAVRNWGVTGGAERLGISHGALSRWMRRRKIPT
jgi:hypothetical protein